jgi:hypothetical protein
MKNMFNERAKVIVLFIIGEYLYLPLEKNEF